MAIWLDVCNSLFKGWNSQKNLKIGVLKPILSKFQSYFGKQPVHILKAEDQLKMFVTPHTPTAFFGSKIFSLNFA